MSKGDSGSSGCARHRSAYVYISAEGSRVCEHCNVLAVRKYVRASMVEGYRTVYPDLCPSYNTELQHRHCLPLVASIATKYVNSYCYSP